MVAKVKKGFWFTVAGLFLLCTQRQSPDWTSVATLHSTVCSLFLFSRHGAKERNEYKTKLCDLCAFA
jgi:hypothetical protein